MGVFAAIEQNEEAVSHCFDSRPIAVPVVAVFAWRIVEPISRKSERPAHGLHRGIAGIVVSIDAQIRTLRLATNRTQTQD